MNNYTKYETDKGEIVLSENIVKKYLVSGDSSKVTDQEVMMFIQMCRYQNLNPFLREAYLIKFGNAPATMVTGKDTFIKRAAKSNLCTGYEAGVIVQKDSEVEYRKGALVLPNETLIGGWAKVYRKDWAVPLENTVGLDEYQRYNSKGEIMGNWAKMPGTMIRKVALVQALREAIPEEFSGLYSPEEMPVDDSKLDSIPINPIPDIVTADQMEKITALAKQKGVDKTSLRNYSKSMFNKESSIDLTQEEAKELIETLTSMEDKEN